MKITPLGTASAFASSLAGWTCNLIDDSLLVDAAPQAALSLRRLGIRADDLSGVVITHLHGDHVFGFPFILAERSPDLDPLPVIGPEGTEERLAQLCSLAFRHSDPAKMNVLELPPAETTKAQVGEYALLAAPAGHSPESLAYRITGPDGTSLGYSGDAAWCAGLETVLRDVDAAMVEMTHIDGDDPEHLSLRSHLPLILEVVRDGSPVFLSHLSYPSEDYQAALQQMALQLPAETADSLGRVKLVEELAEYHF